MTHRDDDALWARIRRVFRLPRSEVRIDAEVDEELRFHLEGRIEDLMRSEGLSRAAAEREARKRFGDYAAYRTEARAIDHATHHHRQRIELRETLTREIGRATRALRRTPGFTAVTIATLALGIGATTAIFTLLDSVVLRPLPYRAADRLVQLSSPVPLLQGQTRWGVARHQMYYFLEQGRTLENLGVYMSGEVTLLPRDGRPERVRWVRSSASLFDVLGFAPLHGRLLLPDDNRQRIPNVAVIGHGLWQRRYGSDPSIVGRSISIEGFPVTVVGVMPPGAGLPDLNVDIWAPAHVDSTTVMNNHTWNAIGRLAPGFTVADAQQELAALTRRLPEAFPQVYRPTFIQNTGFTTEVVSLRSAVVGDVVTRALWTLFGSVALVLLIAGANIANLYLVRIDARRRDVAVRTALGASRSHLAIQYLTESFALTLAAGALALLVAQALLRLILRLAPSELPRLAEVHLGGAAVAFALGVSVLTAIVFGLLPLAASRMEFGILREAGRGLTSSRGRVRARRTLVAVQMAFAVVLLACAGLMFQTFRNLRSVPPGFDPRGVLALEIALPASRYERDERLTAAFHEQLTQRVLQLPGVTSAGTTDRLPLLGGDLCIAIMVEGPTPESASGTCPPSTRVSPGYFAAMGTRVDGRVPDWAGVNAGEGGVVVSRAFADHIWPGQNPIGKGLRFNGARPPWYRVVGVAEDVRALGVQTSPIEAVYFPVRSIEGAPLWGPPTNPHLVVKVSAGDPIRLVTSIGSIVEELDPQAAVSNPVTMETLLARSMAKQSFTMALLLVAATIALLLSAVGIYGVISYIVAQRRGEIGVRMALGASVREVTTMVLRQSVTIAVAGIGFGVLAAIATTRFLRALLFGVEPADPLVLALVPLILLAVAAIASYAPARRAAAVDPATVLRAE